MEGAEGGCAWPVGKRLPVIVAGWLKGAVWLHQAYLCWRVKTVHVIHNWKTMPPPPKLTCHLMHLYVLRALTLDKQRSSRGEIILIDWTPHTFWKWQSLLASFSVKHHTSLCQMNFGRLTNYAVLYVSSQPLPEHRFVISTGGYTTQTRTFLTHFSVTFILPPDRCHDCPADQR